MDTTLTIPWQITAIGLAAGGINFDDRECGGCKGHLDLLQPNPDRPAELIAVCVSCHAWYLVSHGLVLDVHRTALVGTAIDRLVALGKVPPAHYLARSPGSVPAG